MNRMFQLDGSLARRPLRWLAGCLVLLAVGVTASPAVHAQLPPLPAQGPAGHAVHLRYSDRTPPGAIAAWNLRRGVGPAGYLQWIELRGPEGMTVRFLGPGEQQVHAVPARVPLLLGGLYRFEISNFADMPGVALYPTLEVIDRLYPPAGAESQFPVPVEITADEIDLALQGRLITKVIVVEEPDQALPVASDDGLLPVLEVGPSDNPLYRADLMGRPIAVLRLGSRVLDEFDSGLAAAAPAVLPSGVAEQPGVAPAGGLGGSEAAPRTEGGTSFGPAPAEPRRLHARETLLRDPPQAGSWLPAEEPGLPRPVLSRYRTYR